MTDSWQRHVGVVLSPLVMLAIIGFCQFSVVAQNSTEPEAYFVTVAMNGIDKPGIYPVIVVNDAFYLEERAFIRLGTLVPDRFGIEYRGRLYFPLSVVDGLSHDFDRGQQHLDINCLAICFPEQRLSTAAILPDPDPTPFGVFINYDLLAEISQGNEFVGGLAEIGVFSSYGSGILSLSGRDITNDADMVRLETNWTIDKPSRRERLRFGDSITRSGGWGQALRFGGIQFGTDFSLQPGFISFPTPTITGGAALPSTAEIYVNGLRRESIDLEPGPFTIEQPPIITGAGDLLVVVRDPLGRETVITQPFYASRSLLKEGLREYSFEAGFLRDNYAINSNQYGNLFASASYRKGFSDRFTAGLHAEVSESSVAVGPYWDWQLPLGGVLSGAASVSAADGDIGALVELQVDWSGQNFGFSASNDWISRGFYRLGSNPAFPDPVMETSANLGIDVSDVSSLSFNYIRVDEREEETFQIASANFSLQVGELGSFNVNFSRTFGAVENTSLFMLFTTRIGGRTSASVGADRSAGKWTATVRANRSAPSSGGLGLRAEASAGNDERFWAGAVYDTLKGIVSLEHSQIKGAGTTRVGARGGLVVMGGGAYLSNPVGGSFALVEVGGQSGVEVSRDNRPVGETNSSGRLFVPRLRAYEANRLSIDPLDLPLTTEIDSTVMMAVPRRRSGVIVSFPVTPLVAATARIMDDSGTPLPAGTVLRALNNGATFPVGFGGAVYITGLSQSRTLRAETTNGDCVVKVPATKPGAAPTALGNLICIGVNQ